MSGAYYNEIDKKAAAWLRELIRRNLIAPGEVDERSICDIAPYEIQNFSQVHFFAGIGVWSYSLRLAGWDDRRPVWTGSCPCQPFSQAGKGAGTSDERHLWPYWEHLIRERQPSVIFGEQVASKAADSWADLVQDDLEALGYAFGAVPFPAASVGAPHIRDRLYWCAVADYESEQRERSGRARRRLAGSADDSGGRVADTDGRHSGAEGLQRGGKHGQQQEDGCVSLGLADHHDSRRVEHAQRNGKPERGQQARALGDDTGGCGGHGVVADDESARRREERAHRGGMPRRDQAQGLPAGSESGGGDRDELGNAGSARSGRNAGKVPRPQSRTEWEMWRQSNKSQSASGLGDHHHPGLEGRSVSASGCAGERSPWAASDFVWCRDGKWRPIEPGTFPLVDGAPARVGRLRGYGNAIVAQQAALFIEASGLV